MTILASILIALLGAVALIHGLWAIGFWFPIRDEARLVRAVVGAKDASRMPGPIPCSFVAAALLVVIFALLSPAYWVRDLVLSIAAVAFILRGFLAWVPMWRRMTPQEPFATLDRYAYGPLCLVLGMGIVVLVLA